MAHTVASPVDLNRGLPAKLLVVLHQEHSTPGRVGALLRSFGLELDIRRPSLGCALPKDLAQYVAVAVFGGPMSANDNQDWLRREIDWLARPLYEQKPILGLCLGAQLLARQLSSRVYSFEDGRCELGYRRLQPTSLGDAICSASFPRRAYQWHYDGFDLPRDAFSLADGVGDFPNQAYLFGRNAVGLQFHPEVTFAMMCRWTARKPSRPGAANAFRREDHLDGWFQYDRAVSGWLTAFLRAWVEDRLKVPATISAAPPLPFAAE